MSDPHRPHPWPPRHPNDWPSAPAGAVDPLDLRLSDAERAQVTDALCRHFADGRLDDEELAQRSALVAASKTRRDLAGLLDDLPPLASQQASSASAQPAPRRLHPWMWVMAAILIIWVAGAAMAAGMHAAFHPWVPWWLLVLAVVLWSRRRHHGAGRRGPRRQVHSGGAPGWSGDRWVA